MASAAAPPVVVDDPVARCLLQRAQGCTQKWPEGFRGFRAHLQLHVPGRAAQQGTVTVRLAGEVGVELEDPELVELTALTLRQLSAQFTPRFFKDGDGRFSVSLGCDDDHPLGRLVQVWRGPDDLASYRIDGKGRIRLEEVSAGGRRTVTTVAEYARATPGRVLPARLSIASWDLRTGSALSRQEISTAFVRVDHAWLPARRHLADEQAARSPLLLELSRHRLL